MTIQEELKSKGLTSRELEVVELVITGLANNDVADRLCVVPNTVKYHLTNIYKRLGIKNRTQLMYLYLRREVPFKVVSETIVYKVDAVLPGGVS